VKSRFLVGIGAWLLGAAAATGGSMIAVNQLAHGLLGPQTQQLTQANLSINPDAARDQAAPSPTPSATPSRATDESARRHHDSSRRRAAVKPAKSPAALPSPSQSVTGKWLQSPDGSVLAVCQAAGAYLQLWTPDQGFHADDVNRGPAAVASVTFEGPASELNLQVSCVSGTPVAHISQDH
jgi:hypothetical protein